MKGWYWSLAGLLLMTGCTTVYERGNGRVVVTRVSEQRSPFGTNITWTQLTDCEAVKKSDGGLVPLFGGTDYFDCQPLSGWVPMASQGQGGQIAQGVLNGAGLVGLGALMPSAGTTVNAVSSSSSAASATAKMPGAGHK